MSLAMIGRGLRQLHVSAFWGKGSTGMKPLADSALSEGTRLLLIAGAPRCGTTAMSRYLGKHPRVCLSRPKETHFFLSPTSADDPAAARNRYRRGHFPLLTPEDEVLLDGSISYLYRPEAAKRALKVFPQARFVVMLRNPVDLVHSYHSRLLYYRQETETDLKKAWELESARRKGQQIPTFCSDPEILYYSEVGSLGRNLEAFLGAVGRERCHWVFYDDFIADPQASYRAVLEFAGLSDDGRTEFPRKAPNRTYRSGLVQYIYSGAFLMPLLPVNGGSTAFYGRLAHRTKPFRRWLRSFNSRQKERQPLDASIRTMLLAAFGDDIERLASLTGHNLDSWRGLPVQAIPEMSPITAALPAGGALHP
jgi:hypothetical protein